MVNSFVEKEDFDKKFSVVRNEFEIGENNPFTCSSNTPWRRPTRRIATAGR